MLTIEETQVLREQLAKELADIIRDAHVQVDAEIIHLCMRLGDHVGAERPTNPLDDMSGYRKMVKVEIDLHAVEVLTALQRMNEERYGKCATCGADLSFHELHPNPSERFCTQCRTGLS